MSAVATLLVSIQYFGDCHMCGIPIYGPEARYTRCKADPAHNFFCINGHSAVFKETRAGKAERERDEANRRLALEQSMRADAERQLIAAKGQITKAKNRAAAGLCPCCKRSFANLRRHMATKHPEHGGGRDV